jgi:hypothetical protein
VIHPEHTEAELYQVLTDSLTPYIEEIATPREIAQTVAHVLNQLTESTECYSVLGARWSDDGVITVDVAIRLDPESDVVVRFSE